MALFPNFAQAVSLPIQQIASQVGNGVSQLIPGAQKIADFSTPSSLSKQSEALTKLATGGQIGSFGSVSQGINVGPVNGKYVATDAATGDLLATTSVTVPTGVPASPPAVSPDDNTELFKVLIYQNPPVFGASNQLILDVMPTISESRTAQYKSFSPLQHPGEILKYETTSARVWNITAKLISRTPEEAAKNLGYLNMIRSWVMPFYGSGTGNSEKTNRYLGAPPPILTLDAYGDKMIGPVKCILENYDWQFPNDVDYIQTSYETDAVPFPVILQVQLTMKEAWSPAEYSSFDLESYRAGDLSAAFKGQIGNTPPEQNAPSVSYDRSVITNANEADAASKDGIAGINAQASQYTDAMGTDDASSITNANGGL